MLLWCAVRCADVVCEVYCSVRCGAGCVRCEESTGDVCQSPSLKVCSDTCQLLKDGAFGDTSVALSQFRDRCHALFPLAVAFLSQTKSAPAPLEVNSSEDKENAEYPLEESK